MATKIISMGIKHGPAPREATVIFVGAFANPHGEKALRILTGKSPAVQGYIRHQTKNFWHKFQDLVALVDHQAGEVYLACVGGKHRSVFLADQIGDRLGIPVEHRDLTKQTG